MTALFAPGDLVFARGREWVALPSPDKEMLHLRPLSGTEADAQMIYPALEREPVRPARFGMPTADEVSTQDVRVSSPMHCDSRFVAARDHSARQRVSALSHARISWSRS